MTTAQLKEIKHIIHGQPQDSKGAVKKHCQHGRTKCTCTVCGGKRFCEHKKQKQQCRECDGQVFVNTEE